MLKEVMKIEENSRKPRMPKGAGYAIGLAIGMACGIPYGIVIDAIPIGIAIGAGVGISIGVALEEQDQKSLTAIERKIAFRVLIGGIVVFSLLLLRSVFR